MARDDPTIRVLIAVDPFERRQALAYAVRRRRPGSRVLAVPPGELCRKIARLVPDVVVCHPAGRAARACGRCSRVELDDARAAEAPAEGSEKTAEVRKPKTWTIGPDEMSRVLAAVDQTQGTRP